MSGNVQYWISLGKKSTILDMFYEIYLQYY
jgi:hypothetical protein